MLRDELIEKLKSMPGNFTVVTRQADETRAWKVEAVEFDIISWDEDEKIKGYIDQTGEGQKDEPVIVIV